MLLNIIYATSKLVNQTCTKMGLSLIVDSYFTLFWHEKNLKFIMNVVI
jgi:hypothetical protein